MRVNIIALQGCDVILVQAVGEHMKEALDAMNIQVKKVRKKDAERVDALLKNYLESINA